MNNAPKPTARPVREVVTVTVTGDLPSFRQRRRAARAARKADLTVRQIDPRVMEAALRIADGDTSRLRIMADGSILVVNS